MSKTLRYSLTLALCVLLFMCLFPAACADGLQDLQNAVASGAESFTFTRDTTIPAGTTVDTSKTAITVPVGVTLTIEGRLIIGDFELGVDFQTGSWGRIEIAQGGEVHMTKSLEIFNVFWDGWLQDGSAAGFTFEDGAAFILNRSVGSAGMDYDGLERALEDAAGYLAGSEHLRFHITIGEDTQIHAWNSSITLPERVLLTVNGNLFMKEFYDNGTVTVGENGFVYVSSVLRIGENVTAGMFTLNGTLSVEHAALIPEQLAVVSSGENGLIDVSFDCFSKEETLRELNSPTAQFPHFRRTLWILFPWELEDSLTLPAQVRMYVAHEGNENGSLVIPAGVSVTVPDSSTLCARGRLPDGGAVIQLNGSLVNDGLINLGEPGRESADIALGPNACYSGTGRITRLDSPYALNDAAWTALVDVCAQSYSEPTQYDIEEAHSFTLPAEGLTIPDNLSVMGLESYFIVPEGATLTISEYGELDAYGLDCAGTTRVDGILELEETLHVGEEPIHISRAAVIALDAWLTVWEDIDAEGPEDVAEKFSFESDSAQLNIVNFMEEDAIAASLDYPMFHIPHILETRFLAYPWTLDHDRTLEADTTLFIYSGEDGAGALTIPEGMTLTISEGSALNVVGRGADAQDPAILRVAGLLINNGQLAFTDIGEGVSEIALIDRGVCAGSGQTYRLREPYTILNNPQSADLLLPGELTKLASEALAGGSFGSVMIPAGTSSIAADAFGDRDRLIVFGERESAAETFANEHGFLFAPVA